MEIRDQRIDEGRAFDFGRTSSDYAKFRDIYPEEFYQKIVSRSLCCNGQKVLDLGTGTGVLPRNMIRFGASWTGTDISPEQIEEARRLSAGNGIEYYVMPAEKLDFPMESFDVITACQCFFYFDHEKVMPELHRLLKPKGKLLILYMAWLPEEDEIAGRSEELVLKYNPAWKGANEHRHPIAIPEIAGRYFTVIDRQEYDVRVPFTRGSWHGRMRACRGTGASLTAEALAAWEKDHLMFLETTAPEQFEILHYCALAVLEKKETEP